MRPPPADTSFPAPHCTALQRGWPPHTHCCIKDPPPHCLPCRPPSLPPPPPLPPLRLNASGQAVISNGMAWKAHLYLMVVSAKLLADTENMMQVCVV